MSTLITFKAGDKTPITKNFTRNEFQCSCGCSAQMVDEMLVQKLQTIRTVYDTPLKITSGYRCVKHNAAVGGAKSSKHLYGIAADVKDPTGKLNPVALAILASNTFGGAVVGAGYLQGAVPSTRGPGWTNLWCTSCHASGTAGQLCSDRINAESI